MEIQYCTKCVTPNTRPRIEFDKDGVCNACRYAEEKKKIDWKKKEKELKQIIAKYKSKDGYDCIIPVSGGKDSHFVTHYVKNVLSLTPLCVNSAPTLPNEVGNKNRRNLVEKIGVDHISITANPEIERKLSRIMFIEHGNPWLPWLASIWSGPTRTAIEKKIPLMFYGENGEAEYGGASSGKAATSVEGSEGVKLRLKSSRPNWKDPQDWYKYGIPKKNLSAYIDPSDEEKKKAGIKRLFLGDYIPWNNNHNLYYALNVIGGFTLLNRRTVGTYTYGTSIDDDMDGIYLWMLWPKFGFHRASKSASPDIREGKLSREKAIQLVKKYDGEFPWYVFDKVLDYLKMTEDEFWGVIARFIGDEENIKREEIQAIKEGSPKDSIPNRIPAWIKIGKNKWRHAGTIHGEERVLELPLKRPRKA